MRIASLALLAPLVLPQAFAATASAAAGEPIVESQSQGSSSITSAIDRPDFKVRNQSEAAERIAGALEGAPGEIPDFDQFARTAEFEPAPESLLAAIPDNLILHYIDQSDFDKRLTAYQRASKYIGTAGRDGSPELNRESMTVQWLMMSDSEQRHAKMTWFASVRGTIPLDEFNRYVDLRAYRVLTALKNAQSPGLRAVEAPRRIAPSDIGKLTMPGLRPIEGRVEPASSVDPFGKVHRPALKPIISSDIPYGVPRSNLRSASEGVAIPPPPLKPYGPEASSAARVPAADDGRANAYQPMFDAAFAPGELPVVIDDPSPDAAFDRSAGQATEPEPAPAATDRLPTYFGIPSGLRNGP